MASRENLIEFFSIKRTKKYNFRYINTAISSVPYNGSDFRISFGYTDMRENGVTILEYVEESFFEVFQEKIDDTVNQCQWIPAHPKLFAIATNDIRIYDYENNELNLRSSLLPKLEDNPVISMDWKRGDPQTILTTRLEGQLTLMQMEYGKTKAEMMASKKSSSFYLPKPSCGARFGTGIMENCVITAPKNNQVVIFDSEFNAINTFSFTNDILGIEFSKRSEHVAFRMKNKVCIYDVRNLNKELRSYSRFSVYELPTCFYWSPRFSVLYICTSEGEIIRWWFITDKIERCTNEKKPIPNIHMPETTSNLFFATSIDSPYEPYATSLEAYLSVPPL